MDWVNGMAACRRMERALEQLVEQVKKDVELANELGRLGCGGGRCGRGTLLLRPSVTHVV